MNLSTAMVELKGKEGVASSFGALSVVFGILTPNRAKHSLLTLSAFS